MAEITIVRTDQPPPTEAERAALRRALFGAVRGHSQDDQKAWSRFLKRLFELDAGEIAIIESRIPRNPRFHRKFFALLNVGYEAWEPPRKRKSWKGLPVQKNFERFRADVTVAAGFYEQSFDLDGRLRLEPKSIKFSSMEEPEFEALYSAVADVLLAKVLKSYAGRDELDGVIDRLLRFVQ